MGSKNSAIQNSTQLYNYTKARKLTDSDSPSLSPSERKANFISLPKKALKRPSSLNNLAEKDDGNCH